MAAGRGLDERDLYVLDDANRNSKRHRMERLRRKKDGSSNRIWGFVTPDL